MHFVIAWRAAHIIDMLCQFRLELPHGDHQQNCAMTPNSCQTMATLICCWQIGERGSCFPMTLEGSIRLLECYPLNQETIHVAASQLNACESQVTHQLEPPRCLCLAYHAADVCRAAYSHHPAACSFLPGPEYMVASDSCKLGAASLCNEHGCHPRCRL